LERQDSDESGEVIVPSQCSYGSGLGQDLHTLLGADIVEMSDLEDLGQDMAVDDIDSNDDRQPLEDLEDGYGQLEDVELNYHPEPSPSDSGDSVIPGEAAAPQASPGDSVHSVDLSEIRKQHTEMVRNSYTDKNGWARFKRQCKSQTKTNSTRYGPAVPVGQAVSIQRLC
jgi:hypothetical protein